MGGRGASSSGGMQNLFGETMKNVQGQEVPVMKTVPEGWREIKGAMTAPKGYAWISNGKSRFSKGYQAALVPERALRPKR